ncbi:4-hydroxybutyrate CoA-transferase [bacterium]|nr:4-hydroxybutyrate CoA-transferase [bacterium]MBU4511417.1 4-hydroxybutyrate CoA-transferase [bacterium]
MNWQKQYQKKLVDIKEAIKQIQPGNYVYMGAFGGEPLAIEGEIINQRERLKLLTIVQSTIFGHVKLVEPGMEKYFRYISLFSTKDVREAIKEGRAEYVPCFFSEQPNYIEKHFSPTGPPDVACIQVSSPDNSGFCSLGVSVDIARKATDCSKLVIAEVNDQMPRVHGDSFIHVNKINYMVENNHSLPEIKGPKENGVTAKIGQYIGDLIEDGSTLQLGIGTIPDAVLNTLKHKNNLGIHSEMISDGVVDLVQSGVINCSKKIFLPGKIVVTFLIGTKKLYDFVDDNPMIMISPVSFTNDPNIIAQNNKMTSINSALQVDLTGQVAAEAINFKQISGVGGQVDFIRGANLAKEGKSIIAFPSTAKNGTISRIVCGLNAGTFITTSRNDVDYIVTECGVAQLKNKSVKERAKSLIKIAHPEFRESLELEAKKLNII